MTRFGKLRTNLHITRVAFGAIASTTTATFCEVVSDHLSDWADHLRGYPAVEVPQRHLHVVTGRSEKVSAVLHLPTPRKPSELTPEQSAARAAAMASHPAGSKLPVLTP